MAAAWWDGARRALGVGFTLALLSAAALLGAACSSSDTDAAATTTSDAEPTTVTEPAESDTTVVAPDTSASDTTSPPGDSSAADDGPATTDRPFEVFVPSGYDPATPMPLVLLLHGYTGTGESQESYFRFEPLAESRGFLYVHPDGTVDPTGQQFWNATDACCAFAGSPPDDAAYLLAIIEQVSADYNVDPKAIFLAGHSNGGFMSYRMACEHADTIAGIASLAGATFADPTDCRPSEPVTVLQIHGTSDAVIAYEGGSIFGNGYPSARETVDFWVDHNRCDLTPTVTADVLDLDSGIDGTESDTEAFGGCDQDAQVELWTIDDGSHVPPITDEFSASVVDFLLANPKP